MHNAPGRSGDQLGQSLTPDGQWYSPGVPRKTPTPDRRPAIVLQLEPHEYAVAVWRRDEDGEPVYEILHENIREVTVAATLARAAEAEAAERPGDDQTS